MTRESRVPLIDRMRGRPLDERGYPVPWFVAEVEPGKFDFRIIRPKGVETAVLEERCWVCGQKLGRYRAFVIGPMCAVNHTTAEPASHRECAEWSAQVCPFLTTPHRSRQERGMPEDAFESVPGQAITRNPGVALVWVVEANRKAGHSGGYNLFPDGKGGMLFDIGEPLEVGWYAHGREATRDEVWESIDSGLPLLREMCDKEDGPDMQQEAHAELDRRIEAAKKLLPEAA